MKGSTTARACVAVFVCAAFLWMLALSASPCLHGRVHSDANRNEHTCAVTFVTSGSYNSSGHVPLVSAPVPAARFSKIPALRGALHCWRVCGGVRNPQDYFLESPLGDSAVFPDLFPHK